MTTTCPDCYYWNGTKCVYDGKTNCHESGGGDFGMECSGHATYNNTTKKCECSNSLHVLNFECPVWSYVDLSDDVCDCVQVSCPSGYYAAGIDNCKPCPDPELLATNGNCQVESDVSKSNITGGTAQILTQEEYNGCYLPAACGGTDETGTFVLAGDCLHVVDTSIAPGLGEMQ